MIAATSVALLVSLGPFFTLGPTVAEELYGSTGDLRRDRGGDGRRHGDRLAAGLRWRPQHPIRFAMTWAALWPPAFALFALGPPLWTIVPLFVLVGFGFAMFDVSWDTAIAERIPPHAISRVSSFDWMGSLALLPLGFLLAGPAAEAFGASEVLVVGGLLGLGARVAGLAMPGVWRLKRLEAPA